MLLSRNKKFIFVHIVKTAGSSITDNLRKYDDRSLYLKVLNLKSLTRIKYFRDLNPLPHHVPAYKIKEYLGNEYDNYFSFAFVRNPFDWQVSNYFFVKQSVFHPRNREVRNLSFNEYLDWTLKNNRIYLQSDFVSEQADSSKLIVNFIGKFENIENDFNKVLQKIGIDKVTHLEHTNKSKRQKDYNRYYDEQSINFIKKYYQVDLKNFDYDF